jgi:hypothetical protein
VTAAVPSTVIRQAVGFGLLAAGYGCDLMNGAALTALLAKTRDKISSFFIVDS